MSDGRRPDTSPDTPEDEGSGPAEAAAGAEAPGAPAADEPGRNETEPAETSPGEAPAGETPPAAPQRAPRAALWLGALLVLVIAGVAASPYWAPELAPLLPWAQPPAGSDAALAARVAGLQKQLAAARSDLDSLKSSQSGLADRLGQLAAAAGTQGPAGAAVAQIEKSVARLDKRLHALAAQVAAPPAIDPAEIGKMQQELARLSTVTADLAKRVPALERQMREKAGAERKDAAMLTALLQMRGAVAEGRPFAAEYQAFAKLAQGRPQLVDAARPLAAAAPSGVADPATLKQRLDALAERFARGAAPATPPAGDWGSQILRRLRSVVTIRRVGKDGRTPAQAAVRRAEAALGRGRLDQAVAAIETLSGAEAEAAQSWLKAARERQSVEAALDRAQQRLLDEMAGTKQAPAPAPSKKGAPS